ncbi:glycosyltransferase [Granulosicoccus antarcticus]|nr:glycosyltransferase [Granulosicoccus antarcticus]
MNIILFIDSLANGGSQRQLVNLAIGLHQRDHCVTVITYTPLNHHLPRLEAAGVSFECLNKRSKFDLRPVIRLYQAIRRLKADSVVAFLRTPALYAELAGLLCRRTRIVVSERAGITDRGLGKEHYLSGLGHSLATVVTGNSHHYLDALAKALPWLKPKCQVIYNSIDEQFFENGKARSQLEQPPSDSVDSAQSSACRLCVVAARPSEEKGLLPLINAVVQLVDRGITDFSVHWIGPVQDTHPLVSKAQSLIEQHSLQGNWHWEGEQSEVARCYPDYQGLVLPSLHEGVANSLCEAMASGLPVIATDIADNALILGDSGCGLLCQPDNASSLADAMQALIQLPQETRTAMGLSAYQRARELFDEKNCLPQWERVLTPALH